MTAPTSESMGFLSVSNSAKGLVPSWRFLLSAYSRLPQFLVVTHFAKNAVPARGTTTDSPKTPMWGDRYFSMSRCIFRGGRGNTYTISLERRPAHHKRMKDHNLQTTHSPNVVSLILSVSVLPHANGKGRTLARLLKFAFLPQLIQ